MWVFFLFALCIGIAQLISGFLLEEIVPRVVVHSVRPWEEGGVQEPPMSPF